MVEDYKTLSNTQILLIATLNVEENRWAKEFLKAGKKDTKWERLRIALELGTMEINEDYMIEDRLVCYWRKV